MRKIHLTIAPRRDGLPGAIERASYVEQSDVPEGEGEHEGGACVAWRILGAHEGDNGPTWMQIDSRQRGGAWMVSCRTPHRLSNSPGGRVIGDGSVEAMIAWLDGGAP